MIPSLDWPCLTATSSPLTGQVWPPPSKSLSIETTVPPLTYLYSGSWLAAGGVRGAPRCLPRLIYWEGCVLHHMITNHTDNRRNCPCFIPSFTKHQNWGIGYKHGNSNPLNDCFMDGIPYSPSLLPRFAEDLTEWYLVIWANIYRE